MKLLPIFKGRGAQTNPPNRFENIVRSFNHHSQDESIATKYINTYPKTILNKVPSPDIGMDWSLNPYQGCEHGCVYCYARTTHSYWGYSPGIDFETKILVKKNAPALLAKKLSSKNWKGEPVMISGNTDCYQPIERKLQITRKILEVLWHFKNPVGLITKNSLIERDLDLLKKMAENRLVKVSISLNTLNEGLRSTLEPRTASCGKRLKTIETLTKAGIPVNVMIAPVIPGLNDHEMFDIVKTVAEYGATSVKYIVVRLNGEVSDIFSDWLERFFPDRKDKILNQIADCHGGKVNDSRFKTRMKGEGNIAKSIGDQFKLAEKKFMPPDNEVPFNTDLYEQFKKPQLKLF